MLVTGSIQVSDTTAGCHRIEKTLFHQGKLIDNNQLAIESIKEDEAARYTAFIITISK